MFNVPILYIVFNRIDTVKRTFDKIREIQPKDLYIAAAGPRATKIGEAELCKQVRDYVLSNIDWDCSIHTLFQNENLGCGKGVSTAITWFFDSVPKGIILEDDIIPDMSFFPYCEELLAKYETVPRVMHIAGYNPLYKSKCHANESYYFAKIQHCWGWASWARAWKHYDFDINDNYKYVLDTNSLFRDSTVRKEWEQILDRMRMHEIDTWDYQWSYKILEMDGLCINPCRTLVQNVGMNSGVHYSNSGKNSDDAPALSIDFPLNHPALLDFDYGLLKKINAISRQNNTKLRKLRKFVKFFIPYGIILLYKKLKERE